MNEICILSIEMAHKTKITLMQAAQELRKKNACKAKVMKGKRVMRERKEGEHEEEKRVKDGKEERSEGAVKRVKKGLKALKEIKNNKVAQNC